CDGTELRVKSEEDQNLVRLEIFELTVCALHSNPSELIAVRQKRMRDRFDVSHAAACDQVLHLGDGRWCGAKLRAPMHERQAARLPDQLERPIERGVAAAENDEALAGELGGILD